MNKDIQKFTHYIGFQLAVMRFNGLLNIAILRLLIIELKC